MGNEHPSLKTLEDLIRIQSVNPFFGEDARGEWEIAGYVERRCREAGLKVHRQPVSPGRENVVAELRVGHPENALLFEAHMDTVSLGSMENPLEPTYVGDRLYGRGACDTKGSLAAMLHAVEECARNPEQLSSDVVLCAAVDEERAFEGILAFIDSDVSVAGAVVGEPTDLGIVVAHKGCARFRLTTRGKAAHSSVPHEGDNAIYRMAEVMEVIKEDVEGGLADLDHPLVGPPTIVVSTIRAGTQINIVPEECAIEVDRRIVPGEDAREVLDGILKTLQERLHGSNVHFDAEELLLDWPLDTPPESATARCAQRVASEMGLEDRLHGVAYGSDASKLQQLKGVPSIVFGPGSIAQAHSGEEWVPAEHVERAAEFYAGMVRGFGLTQRGG
ncbi:MAG: Acetylornithine deacetylase [uncultured Rubrobacteraceae bacterium]|uniref:Acetylornithine deacetylase n=1 Tax=uncultured Rubrobacteraceae bacterium TaxID=349277 RepID=A0A6J4Q6F5_9ACTN|nr:MAG: Acetylornithine deacetylase [uncultured Rubrobacteraceae bacterium]